MAKKRKRDYCFRKRKLPEGGRLEGDRKIPFCIDCEVRLVPDWKTSVNTHLRIVKGVPPSDCKVLFPKRGPKFNYKTKEEAREANAAQVKVRVKLVREEE